MISLFHRSSSCSLAIVISVALLGSQPAVAALPGDYHLPSLGGGYSSYANQQEIRLGRAWARRFQQYTPPWRDPISQRYVEQLIARLLPHAQLSAIRPLLLLIEDDQINAFAVPGGVIGVNGGLLVEAPDQDALAAVLAHELGHLAQHHFSRQQGQADRDTLPTLAGMLAGLVMAGRGSGDAGLATMASSQAAFISRRLTYSRQYEQEADRVGLTTLAKAGLDPQAMPRMFDIMLRQSSLMGDTPPEFLLTHPLTGARISDTRLRATQYPHVTTQRSLEYELIRIRALLHFMPGESTAIRARLVEEQTSSTALDYFEALVKAHQHHIAEAIDRLDRLSATHPTLLMIPTTAAMLLFDEHRATAAWKRAQAILRRAPDYTPALLVAIRAALEIAPTKAYPLACSLTEAEPENAEGWQLLAQAAQTQHDTALSALAMIESRQLQGDLPGALALLDSTEQTARAHDDHPLLERLELVKTRLEDYQRDDQDAF